MAAPVLCAAFFIPLVPLYSELAMEIIYPYGEASGIGYMWATSKVLEFSMGLILTHVVLGESKL